MKIGATVLILSLIAILGGMVVGGVDFDSRRYEIGDGISSAGVAVLVGLFFVIVVGAMFWVLLCLWVPCEPWRLPARVQ